MDVDLLSRGWRWRFFLTALMCLLVFRPVMHAQPVVKTVGTDAGFQQVGSTDSLRYLWQNHGATISLNSGGIVSVYSGQEADAQISFTSANPLSRPRGEAPSATHRIYYVSPPLKRAEHSNFHRVRYAGIYPGIDLLFDSNRGLEYSFILAPFAKPDVIGIRYQGSGVGLNANGEIEFRAHSGRNILQHRPFAYQTIAGKMRQVQCAYRLKDAAVAVLELGTYDHSQPLFIDPVLDFSTYFGGSGFDAIYASVADAEGNLYVTGESSSGSLTNAAASPRSSRDVFVAKFSSSGTELYSVFLGGSGYDSGRGMAIDTSGNIYITGITDSSDFPVTHGSFSTSAPGAQNAFVAKFNSNFVLQYATYLGGGSDSGFAIAVDGTGAAYVAGQTQSMAFPVTTGTIQATNGGGISDCFVSKLNAAGSALVYSTFLGGSALDLCAGIAVDTSGNAYVTGTTYSTNFPVRAAIQSNLGGTASAFVTKLNSAGTAIMYSTYLGGSNVDNGSAIAVDSTGAAYVTGATASADFPTTPGVFQGQLNGQYNVFVSKLAATGATLAYSTLLGGSGSDMSTSIAIDASGRAIIGGFTSSSNFPTSGAIQTAFQGVFDAFSTVLDPAGATLVFSSYFGGSGDDRGYSVAWAPPNRVYLAGMTSSANFPTADAAQSALSVPPDAFALEISYLGGTPANVSVTPDSGSGTNQTFALQYSDTAGVGYLQWVWVWFSTTSSGGGAQSCLVDYQLSTNHIGLLNDTATAWLFATAGSPSTLQNSQCSVNPAATSASQNGNAFSLNLPVTFASGFAGAKNIYMASGDVYGANTGWQQLGTYTINASAPITVTVAPSNVVLEPSKTQQFIATVAGSSNSSVNWSVSPAVGAISGTGLYTAPSTISTQQNVTITATSAANGNSAGSIALTLSPSLPVNLTLTNLSITSGTSTYMASNSVSASSNFTIGGSASVTFAAANSIVLGVGFHATAGSSGTAFNAVLNPNIH